MKKKAEELIRSLVPELQELKEGCRLTRHSDDRVEKINRAADVSSDYDKYALTGTWKYEELYIDELIKKYHLRSSDVVILGSEIHLEHIMLAVERTSTDRYLEMYTKRPYGITVIVWRNGAGKQVDYNYNKPFQEQSEEFYKFIIDILK